MMKFKFGFTGLLFKSKKQKQKELMDIAIKPEPLPGDNSDMIVFKAIRDMVVPKIPAKQICIHCLNNSVGFPDCSKCKNYS